MVRKNMLTNASDAKEHKAEDTKLSPQNKVISSDPIEPVIFSQTTTHTSNLTPPTHNGRQINPRLRRNLFPSR